MGLIGIEWNVREAVDFQDRPNIEVETIAHNLYVDPIFLTFMVEPFKGGIDL